MLQIKRVYDPPSSRDGTRVLVDRLWPRALSKDRARVDLWLKELAPSTELRRWFGHDPERFAEFRDRYRRELAEQAEALAALRGLVRKGAVTLLFAAHDVEHNNAVVLREVLARGSRRHESGAAARH